MLRVIYESSFKKDLKKIEKRNKNIAKLKDVMTLLSQENPLPQKHRNHKLKGNFNEYWECHIEPDWLLIYKKTPNELVFARTGTHSDLY